MISHKQQWVNIYLYKMIQLISITTSSDIAEYSKKQMTFEVNRSAIEHPLHGP